MTIQALESSCPNATFTRVNTLTAKHRQKEPEGYSDPGLSRRCKDRLRWPQETSETQPMSAASMAPRLLMDNGSSQAYKTLGMAQRFRFLQPILSFLNFRIRFRRKLISSKSEFRT
jgi:hypothetical protein